MSDQAVLLPKTVPFLDKNMIEKNDKDTYVHECIRLKVN